MVRIGTWNLENFAPPSRASASPDDSAAYEAKLANLAAMIVDLGPDVLAVQEVLNPVALADLVKRLPGTWRTALADPDGRGIRVGFLSRAALTRVEQVTNFPAGLGPVPVDDVGRVLTGLGRPGLRARIRRDGWAIDVISVHLKSKLLTFPGGRFSASDEDERARFGVYALHRRAAEAAGIRAYATWLLTEEPGAGVVVAGDLNDEPEAATTQILHGPPGSEVGTGGFDRPDAGDAQRLWNTAAFIDAEQRWSRLYRGRREFIDHVLVSHALIGDIKGATTGGVEVDSIGDQPAERRNKTASDHRPVLVDLAH